MKAVTANASLGKAAWQWEDLGDFRLGSMERRIETADLGNAGERLAHRFYPRKIVGLVQWCERNEAAETANMAVVKKDGRGIGGTAMYDAVANSGNVEPHLAVSQPSDQVFQSEAMILATKTCQKCIFDNPALGLHLEADAPPGAYSIHLTSEFGLGQHRLAEVEYCKLYRR